MLTDQERLIYFWELRTQVGGALRAWSTAEDALQHDSSENFWHAVDSFLSASIAVTNLLWPSTTRKSAQTRAAQLRAVIGASAAAPEGLRDVRNGFEHFDERIDEWRATSANHNFVDTLVGPLSSIGGVDRGDIARHFDPQTGELGVFGKITSVPTVLLELEQVRDSTPPRH